MAKRRRQRISLGGSSVEHLQEAKISLDWATKTLRAAGTAASAGKCATALHKLTSARLEIGRARGNIGGGHHQWIDQGAARSALSRRLDRLDRLAFGIASRFLNKCVPGKRV
jgi:endonuclease I